MNGRIFDNKHVGKFTCIKERGSSIADYVLYEQYFFKRFSHFKVHDPNIFSDHCIITFSLKVETSETVETSINEQNEQNIKLIFNINGTAINMVISLETLAIKIFNNRSVNCLLTY